MKPKTLRPWSGDIGSQTDKHGAGLAFGPRLTEREEAFMDIGKVFHPSSIAIIGVSDKKGSYGGSAAKHAAQNSNANRVYYVHPTRVEFMGKPCYPTIFDLPETVDCILVCTPRQTVNPLLREAGERGVGGAIVYASGFSEEHTQEGEAMEREMVEIAARYDMAVVGPNCLGTINNVDKMMMWGLHTTFGFEFSDMTGLGVVAQSGYIAGNIMGSPGLSVTYAASSGNGNVLTLEEIMLFYAKSSQVRVIAAYLEGIKKPECFEEALRTAAISRKPVVILKTGQSRKGAAAAASHTGNLAGSAKCYEAIFQKYGVVSVTDLVEFMAVAQMFCTLKGNLPRAHGLASVNLSGGENALCADVCEKYGLVHPDYTPETEAVVKSVIPPFARSRNPLDATTELFYSLEGNLKILQAIRDQPDFGAVTMGMNLDLHRSPVHEVLISALCQAATTIPGMIPIFLTPSHEAGRNKEYREMLQKAGVVVTPGGEKGYKMVRYLMDFAEYDYREHTLGLALPGPREQESPFVSLSEGDSKREMMDFGIPVPPFAAAASHSEVRAALADIPFPAAIKIDSPDITHKTEAGGVKLNIKNEAEALQAFDEIMESCRLYQPAARRSGVLIQQMLPQGTEILLGVTCDSMFGPMVMAGLGGVFAEVFQDVALYPAPMGKGEARKLLESLKSYRLLEGYRGQTPRDIDALCELVVKVADYAVANKEELKELDLNPVFVYEQGKGIAVIDALVVKRA